MDHKKYLTAAGTMDGNEALRLKNLETVLRFMTDEEDAQTGEQAEKRRNRYKLFTGEGVAYRYGAGYVYKGKERIQKRDKTNVDRFPEFYTTKMEVFQTGDPNRVIVYGYPTGYQVNEAGERVRDFPPTESMLNLFILEDGLIKEYGEFNITPIQYPHDVSDIETLRAAGMEDQIL